MAAAVASSGGGSGRGTNRAGAGSAASEYAQQERIEGRVRTRGAGAETGASADAPEAGPIPEAQQSISDRIDNVAGRLATGERIAPGTIDALLRDSGLTREDLDIRVEIAREEIATRERRAAAVASSAARDAASDVLASAAERAEAKRKEAAAIEAEARAAATALTSEFADAARAKAEKDGIAITDAVVSEAEERWKKARTLAQRARSRKEVGAKMLAVNERTARAHMQRCSSEYMRLKNTLDAARQAR